MSLKTKALSGVKWQIAAIAIQAIISLITLAIYGRLISYDAFGQFAILNVFMLFVVSLTEFGFGASLIQLEQYKKEHLSFAFYASILLGVLTFLVMYFSAPWIAQYYENKVPQFAIQIVAINLIIKSLGVVSNALLIREFKFKQLFISILIGNLVGGAFLGVFLAYKGYELWALVLSLLFINLIIVLINFYFTRHSIKLSFNTESSKEILSYGSGLTGFRLIGQLGNTVDKLILGKYLPMNIVGFYDRAFYLSNLPKVYVAKSIDGVLFSSLSRLQNSTPKFASVYLNTLSIISVIMLVFSINLFFFSEEIITLFIGEKWRSAAPIVRIFSFYAFIILFIRFSDTVIRAKNRFLGGTLIKIIFTIIKIGVILYFINDTLITIASGAVFSYFIHAILIIGFALHIANIPMKQFLKAMYPMTKLGVLLLIKTLIIININLGLNSYFLFFVSLFLDVVITVGSLLLIPKMYGLEVVELFLSIIESQTNTRETFISSLIKMIRLRL